MTDQAGTTSAVHCIVDSECILFKGHITEDGSARMGPYRSRSGRCAVDRLSEFGGARGSYISRMQTATRERISPNPGSGRERLGTCCCEKKVSAACEVGGTTDVPPRHAR